MKCKPLAMLVDTVLLSMISNFAMARATKIINDVSGLYSFTDPVPIGFTAELGSGLLLVEDFSY